MRFEGRVTIEVTPATADAAGPTYAARMIGGPLGSTHLGTLYRGGDEWVDDTVYGPVHDPDLRTAAEKLFRKSYQNVRGASYVPVTVNVA